MSPALASRFSTTEPSEKPLKNFFYKKILLSGSDNRESACNAGHPGSSPGSGRFPGNDRL